ncbi:MAG: hypothetical protein A3F40_02655 [Chlamydiae bacterium RIFCSPHIGHO2_12_FULL_27_8]|nr:MAG: hypothetical protein A3F40_02655 [Chlamydiae bacterium RIFCSPHIGHO2_12_FULL_27_8]OGN66298.1 MAG: hypothetical protein A2888_00425 [Chlamydiae bacterium RIFCSPLOWO2_01_FULL_28_7]
MLNNYYFLGSSLPSLDLKKKPEISFEEFLLLCEMNLSKEDLNKINLLRKYIDLLNLRLYWQNNKIDKRGLFNVKQIENIFLTKDDFFDFVFDFIEKYQKTEDRVLYFSFLQTSFYHYVFENESGFLTFYFSLIRRTNIVLTALRAKRQNRDILKEFQFEDKTDDLIIFFISQKDSAKIEILKEDEKILNIYENNISNPRKLNYELLKYLFNEIEHFAETKIFKIDQILSFAVMHMISEDFNRLDFEEGKKIIESL